MGDNVYIGPGTKIFGDIKITSGCRIGANAVVGKNWEEENSTLVGAPAKKSYCFVNNQYAKKTEKLRWLWIRC